MNVIANAALLGQPQLEGVNYSIFWSVVGVLLLMIAILVWRNFARPKPAPEDVPTVPPEPIKPSCEPLRLPHHVCESRQSPHAAMPYASSGRDSCSSSD